MSLLTRLLPSSRTVSRTPTAEACLAASVVAMVGLMIVPLPSWLLDLLLAGNLALSVTILMVTLYVRDALQIAAFPTILLLTTLFRLALNVSSTRLILLKANAGEVIRAFGQFVVSGNYVVGAVIFLVLVLIQFVVIAKGSERVAEVAARFALDALPGKQMAIDAELRSATIDARQARKRRTDLSRESQFYGAMDGAMKFVKGDVVASFLITLINVVAGLTIGVAQRDLSVGVAAERYGLLTIGDGLVSQIPALILATSAGLLVTRVASDTDHTPLGRELSSQLLGSPQALRMSGAFILLLAAVPGLPVVPFLVAGGGLWAFASRQARLAAERVTEPSDLKDDVSRLPQVWSLAYSTRLAVSGSNDSTPLSRQGVRVAAQAAREDLFRTLGVILPAGALVPREDGSNSDVLLSVREIPTKTLHLDAALTGSAAVEELGNAVFNELKQRAADFMGLSETQQLLDEVTQVAPATVQQVVPQLVSLPTLTEILRLLVREGVSVRDMSGILEALARVAPSEKNAAMLAEHIRSWLRGAITYDVTGGAELLQPLTLDDSIEDTIRDAVSQTALGSYLTLGPAAARDIVAALKKALDSAPAALREKPVLLTQPDIRRHVRELLESELPHARVVTFAELLPDTRIQSAAVASLYGM